MTTHQLTEADLAGMTAEEIVKAREDGALADYLSGPPAADRTPPLADPQYSAEDLKDMTPDEIVAARLGGHLVTYMATSTHQH